MTVNEITERFAEHRPRLRAVAYRMLGSLAEADDAVQEAWLRCSRANADDVEHMAGWLTTIVARVCLNMLRTRASRREEPLDAHVPDPVVGDDPEQRAVLADSVGLALLVVLDTLSPAERLAFVLHDMFGVPFDDIAPMIDKSPTAARQLASRARRRVRSAPVPDPDLAQQHAVVDAFFAAARDGDFDALVAVLHPDVVVRSDGGVARAGLTSVVRGAETVAAQVRAGGSKYLPFVNRTLVNGVPGAVVNAAGRGLAVMAFTVTNGVIVAIDVLYDPDRLATLPLESV